MNRIKSIPRGVKASFGYFFAMLITQGISYITTPIFTRILSTEEYGAISVYRTWAHLFGILAMFSLSYGVFNVGMVEHPDEREKYSLSMLSLSNVITLIVSGLLILFYPIYSTVIHIGFRYILLMATSFLFQPAYNFWVARQRFELKYKATMTWSIICSLLSPAVSILLINLFPEHHIDARLFGGEGILILIYIGFYFYLFKSAHLKIETSFWKNAFLFNLPLIPHYLSTYMLGSSDKLMISALVSESATAFYSLAYAIAALASTVWSAVNASLVPYTYEKLKERNNEKINNVVMPIMLLFVLFSFGVIVLAPEVMSVLGPDDYHEAIAIIPPIVGGTFFQIQYFLYANVIYYYKKTKYVMYASVASMLANIVLNYVFIRQFGYAAAAYTTLICYLLQAILDYFAMKKVINGRVYNMQHIVIMSIFVIILSVCGPLLYVNSAVRYCFAAIFLLLCVAFRKSIVNMLNFIKKKKV